LSIPQKNRSQTYSVWGKEFDVNWEKAGLRTEEQRRAIYLNKPIRRRPKKENAHKCNTCRSLSQGGTYAQRKNFLLFLKKEKNVGQEGRHFGGKRSVHFPLLYGERRGRELGVQYGGEEISLNLFSKRKFAGWEGLSKGRKESTTTQRRNKRDYLVSPKKRKCLVHDNQGGNKKRFQKKSGDKRLWGSQS